jgi:hypothetical protein
LLNRDLRVWGVEGSRASEVNHGKSFAYASGFNSAPITFSSPKTTKLRFGRPWLLSGVNLYDGKTGDVLTEPIIPLPSAPRLPKWQQIAETLRNLRGLMRVAVEMRRQPRETTEFGLIRSTDELPLEEIEN